jgi:CubicO group peptidase (beta-lactamase class C family)
MKDFLGDPAFADDAWPASTPEAEGMDPAPLLAGLADIESRGLAVHSLLVIRHGRRVLEQLGVDQGEQLTPADSHELHSTTKTLTGMLVGIALGEGLIPSIRARAVEFFEAGELERLNPAKDRLALEDLLTMSSGLEYQEGLAENERAFADECAARVFLSRGMVADPGARWNYSTGDSQILAEILRRVTGKTPLEFARERLFAPLGIGDIQWNADGGGTQFGGRGLSLRPRDLARFGWMLLYRGRWQGEELAPATWVEAATRQHVVATSGYTVGENYGYHCWIPRFGGFATRGYMGQNMYLLPDRELLVVFTGALVPTERADATLDDFVSRFVLAAVRSS